MDAIPRRNEETLPRPKVSVYGRETKASAQTKESQQGLAFVLAAPLPFLSVT